MFELDPMHAYQHEEQQHAYQQPLNEDLLVRQHLQLVKRVVNQFRSHASSLFSLEDMQQIGLMGLLEAGRRFGDINDPAFSSFAVCRIRGAILDELRRLDWRSRHTRQQAHEFKDTVRQLTRQLHREPSEQEVMQALALTSDEYQQRLQASVAGEMQSLDQLIAEGRDFKDSSYSDIEHGHSLKQVLGNAIKRLGAREQLLLTLFYQHDLNLHEIALVLELTPARVCQLHKKALKSLNYYLST